jgi:aryl-alcohol dehydrogenase-like predicted oxidoreductase
MQPTHLGDSAISCTPLGFGCATLLGSSGKRESLRALGAAWDHGITLYDTARSYGGGESEALLGSFLKGRRHQAVISTKFGVVPLLPPTWKRVAKPIARTAMSILPSLRSHIGKHAQREYNKPPFTVDLLQESIHQSLRKLNTDYVDLLLLHSPPASVIEQDDLFAALQKLVEAGKVRAAGISADPDVLALILQRTPPSVTVFQLPCNLFDCSGQELVEASPQNSFGMNFGVLANNPYGGSAGVRRTREILHRFVADPMLDPVLREKLGSIDDAVLSDVVLNSILGRASVHAVVAGMMQPSHIARNAAAVSDSRFTPQEIAELRERISIPPAKPPAASARESESSQSIRLR